jgi:hypothetical protein
MGKAHNYLSHPKAKRSFAPNTASKRSFADSQTHYVKEVSSAKFNRMHKPHKGLQKFSRPFSASFDARRSPYRLSDSVWAYWYERKP